MCKFVHRVYKLSYTERNDFLDQFAMSAKSFVTQNRGFKSFLSDRKYAQRMTVSIAAIVHMHVHVCKYMLKMSYALSLHGHSPFKPSHGNYEMRFHQHASSFKLPNGPARKQ